MESLLGLPDPREAFQYTWNGAFALESVPAALYCFLRLADDPRQATLTAVGAPVGYRGQFAAVSV